METLTHKLVARICNYCAENGLLPPGQVRTTKLVYLIERDYYSWEQSRLTDLDWMFYHYGPWSKTLTDILKEDFHQPTEKEISPGNFRPVHWRPPEFDKPRLKFDMTTEGVILRVLERFTGMPYGKLLDYVYFETEPMRSVERGQALDFSTIRKAQRFIDPVSLLPPKIFHKLRKQLEELEIDEISLPECDELVDPDILDLLTTIDSEGLFALPEAEVHIDADIKEDLRAVTED